MSIVERAADMLGKVPEPPRKPAVEGEKTEVSTPNLIERAVISQDSQRPDSPKHNDLAEENIGGFKSAATPVARSISQTLNVDLDRLRKQNVIMPDGERTPISESFRRIKRHILANVANPDAGPGTNLVMIASSLPKEGKTFCTINLAISIAMEMDRTVLLVDADVARPSVTTALGMESNTEQGLMDVLLDRNIDLASVLCKTNIGNLSVLPAGTSHARATELLASEAMRALLQEMAERYRDRIILFDSPPLLVTSEACVLAGHMGQILIVVEAGKTTEGTLQDALGRIESSNVVGVLLNKGAAPGSGFNGGYGYGYGYGA